jgi:hypothetical protein
MSGIRFRGKAAINARRDAILAGLGAGLRRTGGSGPFVPTIKELQAAGFVSLRAIAAGLEERVIAARGGTGQRCSCDDCWGGPFGASFRRLKHGGSERRVLADCFTSGRASPYKPLVSSASLSFEIVTSPERGLLSRVFELRADVWAREGADLAVRLTR